MKKNHGREALNDRFKTAFNLLIEKEEVIPNDHSKGFSTVADLIFGKRSYGHLINKYLNDERFFPYKHVERFCEAFNVSRDYMLKGEGNVFVSPQTDFSNGYRAPSVEQVSSVEEGNILYPNVAALASSALGIEMHESAESFSIPGLQGGQYIAFTISGNSMSPTLADGDMVICRPLDGVEKITDNEVYAVISDNGVQVKRVQKVYSPSRRLIRLKMISDNYLEHDPFFLGIGEVRQILKVDRKLTAL
jgi:hypothetical protein